MVHTFSQTQFLPVDLKTAWNFFSNPGNLNDITPADVGFRIRSQLPGQVYPGLIIVYKITIFRDIPVDWVTEITHVRENEYFVDKQLAGPYSLWHHEHHFKEVENGVEMKDIVHYKLPMGWLGNLFHNSLVKPELAKIFAFRREAVERKFVPDK